MSDPVASRTELRPARSTEREQVIALMSEAFLADPTLGWCFRAERAGYRERLLGYVSAGHDWHVGIGQPLHVATVDGELAGALYAMVPEAEFTEDSLAQLTAQLRERCGEECAERFFRHTRLMEDLRPEQPEHVLSLVGVRRPSRRRGVGTRLVEWLAQECDAHPSSRGIVLETGSADNVAFYRRCGFELVATRALESVSQHCMFRIAKPGSARRNAPSQG